MTDLVALKQTVRRYRELRRTCKSPFPAQVESHFIADALLSKEPITRTALEELGFMSENGRFVFRFGQGRVYAQPSLGDYWLSYAYRPAMAHERFKPQPKHIGSLLSLLLWLEEQK